MLLLYFSYFFFNLNLITFFRLVFSQSLLSLDMIEKFLKIYDGVKNEISINFHNENKRVKRRFA